MNTLLLQAFDGPGAPVLYVILLVATYVVAVALERTWFLWWVCRTSPQELATAISQDDAAALGESPISDVARAGLAQEHPDLAWEAMGLAAVRTEEALHARTSSLLTAGSLATMLGLLGTVLGLMVGFEALDDAAGRAARLSEGIGAAMSSTAVGLGVGIAATLVHGVLDARARQLQAQIEIVARHVTLKRREERV